jgi:hypothetical protein
MSDACRTTTEKTTREERDHIVLSGTRGANGALRHWRSSRIAWVGATDPTQQCSRVRTSRIARFTSAFCARSSTSCTHKYACTHTHTHTHSHSQKFARTRTRTLSHPRARACVPIAGALSPTASCSLWFSSPRCAQDGPTQRLPLSATAVRAVMPLIRARDVRPCKVSQRPRARARGCVSSACV